LQRLSGPTFDMSDFKPLISIITVCLNSSEFIEQTIQSVISQTFPDKEYIIIDGGSMDGTVDIIKKYESHLAYWHSKPDRGLAHAFNLGLEHSQGDWVIYLNADDFFMEPTVLEKMAPHLVAHDKDDAVLGQMEYFTRNPIPEPRPLYCIYANPWQWQNFRRYCSMPHQATFTHRRFFKRVGLFDEAFKIALDYEIFLRAGKNLRCAYVPLAITGFRTGGVSSSSILKTLRESQRAQIKNNALSIWFSWVNLYYIFAHWLLSYIYHKILDRFEDIIIGPDKTIKNRTQSILLILLKRMWDDIRSWFLLSARS
jgi:glycosyltransferase involved in cell wall biosynthesis